MVLILRCTLLREILQMPLRYFRKLLYISSKLIFAVILLSSAGAYQAQAQGLQPNGIYYDLTLTGTVTQTGVGSLAWTTGSVTFNYVSHWVSTDGGLTITPYSSAGDGNNGSLTVTAASGILAWQAGQSSSIPISSYTNDQSGSYSTVTWVPAKTNGPVATRYAAYLGSFSFNIPGITDANNLAADQLPSIDVTVIGKGAQYTFQDLVAVQNPSNPSDIQYPYYGGNLSGGTTIVAVVVPEISVPLLPQVFLLLCGIFLLLRKKKLNFGLKLI